MAEKKKKTYSHHRSPGITQLNISMPKELKKELQAYCQSHDMNVSQFMRKIIRENAPDYGLDIKNKEE